MLKIDIEIKNKIVIWLSVKPLRFIWYYIDLWQSRDNHKPLLSKQNRINIQKIKNKLVIFYRIYPENNGKSPVFANNKLKLVHFCLESFYRAFSAQKPFVVFLLDGCSQGYVDLINSYRDLDKLIIRYQNAGRMYSFLHQLKLAKLLSDDKYIYFAEDDYFYMPNAGNMLTKGLEFSDFFTVYLADKRHKLSPKICNKSFDQYKGTPMTFGTKTSIIKKYYKDLQKAGSWDHPFWLNMKDLGLKLFAPKKSYAFHLTRELIPKYLLKNKYWLQLIKQVN